MWPKPLRISLVLSSPLQVVENNVVGSISSLLKCQLNVSIALIMMMMIGESQGKAKFMHFLNYR